MILVKLRGISVRNKKYTVAFALKEENKKHYRLKQHISRAAISPAVSVIT